MQHTAGKIQFESVDSWDAVNFLHGFTDRSGDDLLRTRPEVGPLTYRRVIALKQVHGAALVDLRGTVLKDEDELTGDGFILEVPRVRAEYLVAIKTADCLPIILKQGDTVALLHGGWRGLAAGIVRNAFELFPVSTQPVELTIGPAAGGCCYEVGKEVITALAPHAIFEVRNDHLFLNLAKSAFQQLQTLVQARNLAIRVHQSSHCTICESNYASYRREGKGVSKNISFIMI